MKLTLFDLLQEQWIIILWRIHARKQGLFPRSALPP
jgi:hypothetical protein